MTPSKIITSLAVLALASAASAADLPDSVQKMVEAAARSGNQAQIDAVTAVAKETNPESAAEIDRIASEIAAERAAAREAELRQAHFFDNWSGTGQLGGALATGNSSAKSLSAGLTLERQGLKWRHRLNATLDIIDSDGGDDQQRIYAGYQLDYQFSPRAYMWGRLEFDRNRQAGIDRRFAESAGFGYRLIEPSPFSWDVEAGPALRQTWYPGYTETRLAARGASRISWALGANATLSNDSAVFWEDATSLTNTLALTSKLFGSLSAQLSYNVAWEQRPPVGRKDLDTVTRATLVYGF